LIRQKKNARKIEEYLKAEKKHYDKYLREPKLLLLGSSDSGKSTLLKQLKILHGGGFSQQEIQNSKRAIISNLIKDVKSLIEYIKKEGTEELAKKYEDLYETADCFTHKDTFTPEIVSQIKELWSEKFVQDTVENLKGFVILDTSSYYFESLDRIADTNYTPNNDDILNLRTVTMSVSDNVFETKDGKIHLIDVSGLKYHRMNWMQYFDKCHCVLFVVSLSCYDQTLIEDPTINRMADSFVLFEQIANHAQLKRSKMIIFMNKKDLYEKKVKRVSIKQFFPEYEG
jgi:GTPase SAR1 family protein